MLTVLDLVHLAHAARSEEPKHAEAIHSHQL